MNNHLTPMNGCPADASPFDQIRRTRPDGTEYWTARDLMNVMGYDKWQNFDAAIKRTQIALNNQKIAVNSHVTEVGSLVQRPQGGSIKKTDYELTRYGCYILFMNGDPSKPEVAAAQAYFATRTREAETRPALNPVELDDAEIVHRALQITARKVEELQAVNTQLEQQAALAAPKVLFADAVATSKASILVSELAKILKANGVEIGGRRLFEWLRVNGYLVRRKGSEWNMPTQRAMDLGLFEVKETAITHSDGHVTVSKTPKVTGKGQEYFISRFLDGTFSVNDQEEAV